MYLYNLISIVKLKHTKNDELTLEELEIGHGKTSSENPNIELFDSANKDSESIQKQNEKTIKFLEENNNKYKEKANNLKEKLDIKQNELTSIKNELENAEKIIAKLKHDRDLSREELFEEKSNEIKKLKSNVETLTDYISRLDSKLQQSKVIQEAKCHHHTKTIIQLQQEEKISRTKIFQLNEEIENLKVKLLEKEEEFKKLCEKYEEEKENYIRKYQSTINELKIEVKNLRDKKCLVESLENSENELSELDDYRGCSSEPVTIYSNDPKMFEAVESMKIVDSLYFDHKSCHLTSVSFKSESIQVVDEEIKIILGELECKVGKLQNQIQSEKNEYEKLYIFNREIQDILTCILYNINEEFDNNLKGDLEKLKDLFLKKLQTLKSKARNLEFLENQIKIQESKYIETIKNFEDQIENLLFKFQGLEETVKSFKNLLSKVKFISLLHEKEQKISRCCIKQEISLEAGFKEVSKKMHKKSKMQNSRQFLFWNKPNPIVTALFKN
ncbi:hypothetical protein SteCoe_32560 [Stentor coeruleus]|uniref:Uncharacterized protein n=1 Tax=Stentor coeruleus TaxID=5963 RepID=A0A1R2AYT5_9CILI|nr:hypothetical protein SteCoe_32560 [Stentor coeruleus]